MIWSLALVPILAGAGLIGTPAPSRRFIGWWSCSALALTLLLACLGAMRAGATAASWSPGLQLTAALPPIAAAVAILVPVIALPVLAFAAAHEEEVGLKRLAGLLLAFAGGMELLVVAEDFLTLLIGWELVGACSWALIAHDWRDAENAASGLYAFVTTRLGDLGLFAAAMAAFAGTGSFAYKDLATIGSPWLEIVAFGVLASAAAKSGQVPFASWLFRAMAGPASVSALLHAATMVAAGAYLLVRLEPFLARAEFFSGAIVAVGLVTAIGGGIVAFFQNHAKKLLAASTSAHYGLMFAAVGAGYPGVALMHLIAHAGFKALLFLVAGIAGKEAGTYGLDRPALGSALPAVAALSAIGAAALAGIPPLGGAWTKEAIVSASESAGFWAAAAAVVAGGLSAAYAARFQLQIYGRGAALREHSSINAGEYIGTGLLAGLSLILSLLWVPQVRGELARLLAIGFPEPGAWGVAASFALVAAGLAAGWLAARRFPRLGAEGTSSEIAEWLGLPALVRAAVTDPFERLASAAARLDDLVVDGGIRLTAAFGEWLSRAASSLGEFVADGIPEGAAALAGLSGGLARRLQTGLAQHYYLLLAGGAVATVVVLLVGS